VARREFDNAISTAKTMFALARHLGEYPTSSANLLGLTIAKMTLDTLFEMVQQPGCPNLYWALTDLPSPLVDLRKGMQGDRVLVDAELKSFREDVELTDEEIEELVSWLSGRTGFVREQAGLPPRNLRAKLIAQAKNTDGILAARTRLIDAGSNKQLVTKFSPLQVVFLDEKREYELRRDEELKLLALKLWEIDAIIVKEANRGSDGLFAELLPRVVEARRAQGRVEQRIALLRHIEALRIFAASNKGKLPAKLADVGVPLPNDPFTDKAFSYKLDGPTVHLRGSAPKGEENNPAFNVRYEVTLK
ncbi:MAG: hypothetical protein L0241_16940, partial [Planctomycetia bacterium]|nr:hypothetical protein [Planctomycetia bacterium]